MPNNVKFVEQMTKLPSINIYFLQKFNPFALVCEEVEWLANDGLVGGDGHLSLTEENFLEL